MRTFPDQFTPRAVFPLPTFDAHRLNHEVAFHMSTMRLSGQHDRSATVHKILSVDTRRERHRTGRTVEDCGCRSIERIAHFGPRSAKPSTNVGHLLEQNPVTIFKDTKLRVIHE